MTNQIKIENKKHFKLYIITLALLCTITMAPSDIYLPSLPNMAGYFNVKFSLIQKTMTAYLLALAIFQLIYGPVSDYFGRKKTLYWGLSISVVGTLICVFAPNLTTLLIGRFIQGAGACSGV